jgi:hypothetical protein
LRPSARIGIPISVTGRKQPLVFGDNELAVRLVPVEELEWYLYLRK